MFWNGWPWDRVVLLFTGIAFLMISIQVFLFHYRQNFRHWAMWLPVAATPLGSKNHYDNSPAYCLR